jgi:hypothetical protein
MRIYLQIFQYTKSRLFYFIQEPAIFRCFLRGKYFKKNSPDGIAGTVNAIVLAEYYLVPPGAATTNRYFPDPAFTTTY